MRLMVIAAAMVAMVGAPALADGPNRKVARASATAGAATGAELRVGLDQARPLQLPAGASGVVIGNPSIAGVTVQTDRLLFITGRSYGSTNLIVVGTNGRQLYQGRITVVADETNALMLNKGGWVSRYDCTPVCRRRPDISEDPQAFSQTTTQIQTRQSMAASR
jgi:Flp pilus assembly secretin CpaC